MREVKKLLLGGSPCTYWSISQSSDKRETTASYNFPFITQKGDAFAVRR